MRKYVAPYLDPRFAQCLNKERPHTLLTKDTKHAGCLEYRYDDTGEEALVPNMWYNQTYQSRVEAVRWDADQCILKAVSYEKNPPTGMPKAVADNIACRYRARAAQIHAEANRMMAAGDDAYPCKASQMQLNYGEHIDVLYNPNSKFGFNK